MSSMKPVHPGEILREEFLVPLNLSAYRVAKDLRIPANRITGIRHEERSITAETAVLLGHYFDTSAEMWMHLQARYECGLSSARKPPRCVSCPAAKWQQPDCAAAGTAGNERPGSGPGWAACRL